MRIRQQELDRDTVMAFIGNIKFQYTSIVPFLTPQRTGHPTGGSLMRYIDLLLSHSMRAALIVAEYEMICCVEGLPGGEIWSYLSIADCS